MSDVVISVDKLGKRYQLGAARQPYKTLRESLLGFARSSVQRKASTSQSSLFWALRDVSFEVKRGEVLAIVGRNGAGKSTLLKILSRIVEPTEGRAEIWGRVGSLLEVGTGFHPELSGRENIFLNGAILGMKRAEIVSKFDDIVAFAEVERFIDTPVKHYSSGMGLKLGFAVAAHLEPEILVIDEVLAVGDAAFQKKCLGKMGDVAKQGRTVLFVSHNMAAVKSLCTRGLLLEGGQVGLTGPTSDVIDRYLNASMGAMSERVWPDKTSAPGNHSARLRAVRIMDSGGRLVEQLSLTESATIEVDYEVLQDGVILNLAVLVYSQDGTCAFATTNITDENFYAKPHATGTYRSRGIIPANYLNEGRYAMTVQLTERATSAIAVADHAVSVDVVDLGETRGGYFGVWPGVVRPSIAWQTRVVSQGDAAAE